ncbi:MAG: hypothetical protein NC411_08640 [Bacteroides sp.]|nr:hypothetical protein [Bacteroides sp.]
MEAIIIPIFICVVLPVAIVLIVSLTRINNDNKRTEVIVKAIEANNSIDVDKLAESLKKPQKSEREILNRRLLNGCIFTLIGIAMMTVGLTNYAISDCDFSADPVTCPMLLGGVSLAVGISFLIVYFVSRKDLKSVSDDK